MITSELPRAERPAVRAKGTVRPSERPIVTSPKKRALKTEQRSMLVQDFLEGMIVVDSGSMVSYFWKRLSVFARRGSQAGSWCLSCDVEVKDMV